MNPSISITFAAVFLFLWYRLSNPLHLLWIAFGLVLSAIGFLIRDFPPVSDETTIRLFSNAAFVGAIVSACFSGLVRADIAIPKRLFGGLVGVGFAAFCWYLYVAPSTLARIIVLSALMAALAGATFALLIRARSTSVSVRLIAIAALIAALLALARPALAIAGVLAYDDAALFQHSTYWITIQAFTPLLTGTVALLFLAAMSIDTVEQLRAEANHDYLTGLLNRRGFESAVDARLSGGHAPRPSLLMADIDDFKKINDSFGHKVGDEVIAAIGKALQRHGKALLSARVGGEEFALYYQGDGRTTLQRHAETIRAAIAQLTIPGLPPTHNLTLSLGIHTQSDGETLADMLIEADRALYKAKTTGKDRAILTPATARPQPRQVRSA